MRSEREGEERGRGKGGGQNRTGKVQLFILVNF